ncbi:23S rRNA pseudouridine(2604) synthase RluF [Shewanella xiamenensis]|uniref:23S rRNA pseudouridine(2604) synthase RluF n=1 Tax=Shewanella TaxID=22 RepID=UPI0006DB458A|nr:MULTISPECIES: 23S rRNA pseudouridine(2604) synthase RluF [Shewanella]PZP32227.1 MAG: 23S rRNA pseudouridine synthase F [Shewanella oneidensis]KPN78299.1 pseudouridine synthase [Shewanella sp. Sh95]MCT8863629.1 23S rRNA pseudouridine(2604) synthase RluF [Shewanella xiamenensis]MCT8876083.1 23S rRNA pseudouridine(2604) synthase RluF [Shewanella xiamenensis]UML92917.1 23S rRNA pseudouridine(2604) synthase RluF [Shewanella xiamenensis]
MRLAKYLAQCGISSRREACRLIEAGRITRNGKIATHHDPVQLDADGQCLDSICLDAKPVLGSETPTYWLFNKAVGTDCRLLKDDKSSLIHLLPPTPRLYPVGRLDKDSRGLLLLTNDGELTHKLMHPSFAHSKTYHVQLERAFTDEFIKLMASGVKYKEVDTLPCKVRRLSEDKFEIVLIQGLNRQIRRMSSALGYKVIDLQRVALMTLSLETVSEDNCTESKAATNTLNTLPEGEMRPLTPTEITTLKAALAI